jgi:hypothetical protein
MQLMKEKKRKVPPSSLLKFHPLWDHQTLSCVYSSSLDAECKWQILVASF